MIVVRAALGLLIASLTLALAVGCEVRNPDFCCTTTESCAQVGVGGPVTCRAPDQPFCDDQGMYGTARACVPDPGTTLCTGPADCPTTGLPVCDLGGSGTCIGCSVADDCARFATTPLCDDGSHACVACRTSADCGGANPVCGTDHTCQPCTSDDECGSGLCIQGGSCAATSDIVYVDRAAAITNVDCTAAAPCQTINGGLAKVTATRKYVKVAPGTYGERLILDGRTVDLYGTGAELTSTFDPVVDVRTTSTLTVTGLRIRGGTGTGLRCLDSTLTLRRAGLEDNGGRGLDASACNVTIEGARVLRNFRGGLGLARGRIAIRNSFIGKNGNMSSSVGGVAITEPFDLAFEFNTIVDNLVLTGATAGLLCQTGTAVAVANNIVVGDAAKQVDADSCAPRYTLSTQVVTGATNLRGTPTFRNGAAGDYHLVAGSIGIDQADPAATLVIDIDGDSRPNGARADIGADELP